MEDWLHERGRVRVASWIMAGFLAAAVVYGYGLIGYGLLRGLLWLLDQASGSGW